jgi:hypothetical protein
LAPGVSFHFGRTVVKHGRFGLGRGRPRRIMAAPMVKRESALPEQGPEASRPQLKRVLGRRDLVLLFVVAVFNLNVVPSIAANGGSTLWLWLVALALFFWPQGVAAIELSHRYPEEGGVYLWAKKEFGDFHGFLSGWCYWTTNMLYIPTVLLYFVGVSEFVLGASNGRFISPVSCFGIPVSMSEPVRSCSESWSRRLVIEVRRARGGQSC